MTSDHTVAQPTSKQIVLSCMIGNALEWYDFVIFGYFAVIIGSLFFPTFDPFTQILASWGVFWAGFIVRPLGSLFFGYLGDKIGRKFALTLSIYVMVIPTALLGCLPTYEHIGIIAPILLVLLRATQGFAMGGEFTGSIIFLIEHADPKHRCLWGSFANVSVVIGVIVGSLVLLAFNTLLTNEELISWGWRIPFMFSVIGGVVGGYMRQKLADPHVFLEVKKIKEQTQTSINPLRNLLTNHKTKVGLIILLDLLTAIGFYMLTIFLATYFRAYLHLEAGKVFVINTANMFVFGFFIFVSGILSDKFGRRYLLAISSIAIIVLAYPLFLLFTSGEALLGIILGQAALSVMLGLFMGTIPISIAEIMPMSVRYTGVSFAHNIAMAIFGGGTPFLATSLIQFTGNLAAPAFLLISAALLSLIATYYMQD